MAKVGEDIPFLVAQNGPLSGERWKLGQPLTVGRDGTCDIVIPDRQVSRHHARFMLLDGHAVVNDLGSKNGTHKNGERIEEQVALADGDIVQVALAQEFVFISADATMPLEDDTQATTIGGKLRIERRSRQVWISDREVLPALSVAQFELLDLLFEADGQVVARKDLMISIWGEEAALDVSNQALDALIRRLRDRLATIDPFHSYVITVRGHGLRLDNPIS